MMNSYELSRNWFDWCFENPDKISPSHTALYFFAIEHCNRLGWKEKFGFPSQMAMEALGIKNWRTYSKILNDLIDWKFIKLIEKSKNQYSSNIIAIVNFTKATTKALDKALQKHSTKQGQSIVSIDKQETNNNITLEIIDSIYKLYPSKCPINNSSTNKSKKDKIKIKKLLNSITSDKLISIINLYIEDCKKSNRYIKNFSTFLNNLPDDEEQKKSGYKYLTDIEKELRHVPKEWSYIHYKGDYKKVHTDKRGEYIQEGINKVYLNLK